ncbi:MAG: hypothetical protein NTY68_03985 [Candidatus Micrarchaeota archaeon]|nr:hypothetical protein [Candidatus Micrarchaeota archaeon]
MNLFMNYGKYREYEASNAKSASFDKGGLACLLADMIDKIDNFHLEYSGLINAENIGKEVEEESKKSGIMAIASSKWTKALCGENPKLKEIAQGFILATAMKAAGMPYKMSPKMLKCAMPKTEKEERKDEMGFVLSFDQDRESTVVKKISLGPNTNEYEIGYFLCSAHNSAMRSIIRLNGIKIEKLAKEKKDMKKLAERLESSKMANDLRGFAEAMRICSSFDLMPFATQRQFLKVYKDLPKPRRMEKIDQPIEAFI